VDVKVSGEPRHLATSYLRLPLWNDAVEKVGGESRWSLAVGWNWEVLGLIGVFCLAHAGLGLDADATN
jgi:hypothetical protein